MSDTPKEQIREEILRVNEQMAKDRDFTVDLCYKFAKELAKTDVAKMFPDKLVFLLRSHLRRLEDAANELSAGALKRKGLGEAWEIVIRDARKTPNYK